MEQIKEIKKKKRSRYSAMEKKKFPFIAITLLYPLVHLCIFWLYVNIDSILLAFQDTENKLLMNDWPFSFKSFELLFNDLFSTGVGYRNANSANSSLWLLFGKSILIWANGNLLCTIISMLTAFILTKHMIGSKFFRTVFYIPGIVGAVVFSTIMIELYKAGGPIPKLIESMGTKLPEDAGLNGLLGANETAYLTMITQQFILGIGGGNMIMAGAFMKVPEEIFESAKLDGCGFFRETFRIAIPCVWTTVSTLMTFSLCGMFVADLSFYLYSADGLYGLENIGFYMYKLQVTAADPKTAKTTVFGYGAALGVFITLITIPLVYLGRFILSKISDNVEF